MKKFGVVLLCILLALNLAQATTFNAYAGVINAHGDYNAKGYGVADGRAAIQTAIYAAYTTKRQGLYLPATGACYKISGPLYLDAPGNLESHFANPINFALSLAMYGDRRLGNNNTFGTQIFPTFQDLLSFK